MNSRYGRNHLSQQGFSLIEIIIALVIFGIVATMLMTVMGTSLTSSSQPVFRLQKVMTLQQTMENIQADFSASNNLAALKTAVGTGQQNNPYGAYTVVANSYVKFTGHNEAAGVAADKILKVSIKDQGTGMVLTKLFVQW